MENLENQNNEILSDDVIALKNRIKVNKQNDLIGFVIIKDAIVVGMENVEIKDKDGNVTGGFSRIKIAKGDCMTDLTFTGSEHLPKLFVPFRSSYDFGFDIEQKKATFNVAGTNGRTFKQDVETTKFKLISYVEHKN